MRAFVTSQSVSQSTFVTQCVILLILNRFLLRPGNWQMDLNQGANFSQLLTHWLEQGSTHPLVLVPVWGYGTAVVRGFLDLNVMPFTFDNPFGRMSNYFNSDRNEISVWWWPFLMLVTKSTIFKFSTFDIQIINNLAVFINENTPLWILLRKISDHTVFIKLNYGLFLWIINMTHENDISPDQNSAENRYYSLKLMHSL